MSTTTSPDLLFEAPRPVVPEPARSDPPALFRYSTWLHVGVGAEGCSEVDEAAGVNGCGDHSHFHAWCRLPNPLQQAEIRERALAAKARKIRQLRDPESDAHAILDEEFAARAREGERARPTAIDELVQLEFWRDYYDAMMEVRQIEDDRPIQEGEERPMRYAHVEDDQSRLMRLEAMPEAERPSDEYEELRRHLTAYQDAINAAMSQRQDPRRKALEQLTTEQLLDELRDKRIESESAREFQRVFEIHEWLSCAYQQPGGKPALENLAVLENAATEIVRGLQEVFTDLKRTAQEASGN